MKTSKEVAEIEELMKAYTVKFENCHKNNKESKGTGFVLTKDGLIATCSHVIQSEEDQISNKRRPKSVRIVFEATNEVGWAEVIDDYWHPIKDGDIAIVKLKKPLPERVQVAPLSLMSGSIGHRFQVFGYPAKKEYASPPGLFGSGSNIHIKIENPEFKAVALHQLDISNKSIASGHSGSAVFDLDTECVVGMITAIDPGNGNGRLQETAYATEIDEFVRICPDLEKTLHTPTQVQTLKSMEMESPGAKIVTQENLPDLLGVPWVRNRPPRISDQMHEKIDSAANKVLMGKKVVILGLAGMGKSTLLYLVCIRLLELDAKLVTGTPPSNIGNFVFVSDNLPRNLDLLTRLSEQNISVIAASRTHEWLGTPGWSPVYLTKDDYPAIDLRKVIVDAAKEKEVRFTDEGIDLAVEKSGGSPGYLVALVEYLKQSNHALDKETAQNVPSTIYEVEAEQLSDIAKAESLSISVLYAIAKTKHARLHLDQTSSLITRLRELKEGNLQKTNDKPDAWTQITYRDRDLHTIKHDTWKELLLLEWDGLNIEMTEPEALIEARNLPIENMLEKIFEDSISRLTNLRTESALRLAQVAVENQPQLAEQLLEFATTAETIPSTMKTLLMNLAAMKNPDKTRTWLHELATQRFSEVQLESDEAPSYMILWGQVALDKADAASPNLMERSNDQISYVLDTMQKLGAAYRWNGLQDEAIECLSRGLKFYRQLVMRDEQFEPDLAKTLTVLGAAFREKGMLDKSVECLKEARDINRKPSAKNEPHKADLADALGNLGSAYWWEGRFDMAVKCSDEALNIYREIVKGDENLKSDLAKTLTILGTSHRERGYLAEAVDSLEEASAIYDELSRINDCSRYEHVNALYNLGAAYWLKGSLDQAISSLEHAQRIAQDYADKDVRGPRDLARTLNNLGIAYRWQGRTDDAIAILERAADLSKKFTDKEGHFMSDLAAYVYVTTLCNLSAAYQQKGMLKEAVEHLEEALAINRAIAEKGGPFILRLIDIQITLGLVYVNRGTANDLYGARARSTEAQKLLKKLEDQQPEIYFNNLYFNNPEYVTLVRGQEDLQSLLLVT